MPCSSSRSANASEVSPAGTSSQRYIVASLPATRMPFRSKRSSRSARLRPYLARVGDVFLVAPGGDGRALDELLRRRPDRRAKGLQRRDQRRIPGREAAPVARHRASLRERVEDDDVGSIGELQRRSRRLLEPELRVGLVRGEDEAVLTRERGELLVEGERRRRAGGVVRVVDPEDGESRPRLVVDRVEVRQEAVLLQQRHRERSGVRECAPRT